MRATACSARSSAFGRIWRGRSTGWGASSPAEGRCVSASCSSPTWRCSTSPGPSRFSRWRIASRGGTGWYRRRLRCRDCRRRNRDVRARHGLVVRATYDTSDAPPFDLLVVPGGVVTQPLGDTATLDYIRRASAAATLTASVCTGAFLLAAIGLLEGRAATTHWEDIRICARPIPPCRCWRTCPSSTRTRSSPRRVFQRGSA